MSRLSLIQDTGYFHPHAILSAGIGEKLIWEIHLPDRKV